MLRRGTWLTPVSQGRVEGELDWDDVARRSGRARNDPQMIPKLFLNAQGCVKALEHTSTLRDISLRGGAWLVRVS